MSNNKTMKITCVCGAKFDVGIPGKKPCPGCGTAYVVTAREITWDKERHDEQISDHRNEHHE